MPWADQTLPHNRITGKNSSDPVTRIPKSNVATADPIPAATGMLIEAKAFVEGKILQENADYIMDYGGPSAFFDAAIASPILSPYLLDMLGWGWLWFWYNSQFSQEDDRFWIQREAAGTMLSTMVQAFIGVSNSVLEVSRNEGVVIKSRVSRLDAWWH